MSKYFHISVGLRGCYMPDNAYVLRTDTRRALKNALEWEARDIRDAGFHINQAHCATIAAHEWRQAHKAKPEYLPTVVPYGNDHAGDRPFGIFVSVATRADYLAYCAEND